MRASMGKFALALAVVLFTAQFATGQFWTKKPYQKWSKEDVQTMLSDSPWAKEVILANVKPSTINQSTKVDSEPGRGLIIPSGRNDQNDARVTYQVQIRSAQPMRQAVVQAGRLGPRYEQMTADQKARVDQSAEAFINAKSDQLVFWVNYQSSIQGQNVDLLHYWQSQTLTSLNNTIWLLIPGADKVEATYFAPGPDQSFEIRFPRPEKLPADGSMVVQFNHPDRLAGQKGQLVRAEFKLKKLIVDGTAVY